MSAPTGQTGLLTRVSIAVAVAALAAGCASAGPAPRSSTTPAVAATGPGPSTPGAPAPVGIPATLRGQDIEMIPTTRKIVGLTFDAGANADGLASVLSTLSARRVPATFFLTGDWASRYPASVRTLVAGGYRLGNHTDTHPSMTAISDSAIGVELATARSKILAAGGTDPMPLFRFPYGDRTSHTIAVVNNAGYLPVRWTVDSLGWKGTSGGITADTVVSRVVGAARPGEIVLMHVGSNPTDRSTLDATALPAVITRLTDLGYGFVTLDALLAPTGPTVPTGCDGAPWRTAPITVTRSPAVPPVPTVTGIRAGAHPECRYDRVVFDITGPAPGYEIRYVTAVTADPSDRPVTVPGGGVRFLLVTLHPAQARAAIVTPTSAALGYPMLKGYAVSGDYEGYLSVALGLAGPADLRVGELAGRLYIDVSYG